MPGKANWRKREKNEREQEIVREKSKRLIERVGDINRERDETARRKRSRESQKELIRSYFKRVVYIQKEHSRAKESRIWEYIQFSIEKVFQKCRCHLWTSKVKLMYVYISIRYQKLFDFFNDVYFPWFIAKLNYTFYFFTLLFISLFLPPSKSRFLFSLSFSCVLVSNFLSLKEKRSLCKQMRSASDKINDLEQKCDTEEKKVCSICLHPRIMGNL